MFSVKMLAGAFEYWTRSGESNTEMVRSGGWQVSAGRWQEPLVSIHVDFFTGLLEYSCNMAAGFPQSK